MYFLYTSNVKNIMIIIVIIDIIKNIGDALNSFIMNDDAIIRTVKIMKLINSMIMHCFVI